MMLHGHSCGALHHKCAMQNTCQRVSSHNRYQLPHAGPTAFDPSKRHTPLYSRCTLADASRRGHIPQLPPDFLALLFFSLASSPPPPLLPPLPPAELSLGGLNQLFAASNQPGEPLLLSLPPPAVLLLPPLLPLLVEAPALPCCCCCWELLLLLLPVVLLLDAPD